MKKIASLLLLCLAACATNHVRASYPDAQRIVEQLASRHADVVRLTIHAVPRGESRSRIIASNVAAKIGAWSDPEDTQAMETKQPVILEEGQRIDYTAPVLDASGTAIAAIGVLVDGTDPGAMLSSASQVARELSAAILAADKPLW